MENSIKKNRQKDKQRQPIEKQIKQIEKQIKQIEKQIKQIDELLNDSGGNPADNPDILSLKTSRLSSLVSQKITLVLRKFELAAQFDELITRRARLRLYNKIAGFTLTPPGPPVNEFSSQHAGGLTNPNRFLHLDPSDTKTHKTKENVWHQNKF